MAPLRVGVIFGGRSGEHEVSLASGASVIAALEHRGHTVVPIGIGRDAAGRRGDPLRACSQARVGLRAATRRARSKGARRPRRERRHHAGLHRNGAQEPAGGMPAELRAGSTS